MTILDWVIAGAAVAAVAIAARNLRRYTDELSMNTFAMMLKEISDEEASIDKRNNISSIAKGATSNDIKEMIREARQKTDELLKIWHVRKEQFAWRCG